LVHDGTVAAAMTRQLTTTGRVQERLEFCVAALTDAASVPANCGAFPSATTIDLGVIDNSSIAVAPVDNTATNPANDSYGAAMVNTNASNGVVITYFPEAATTVSASDTDQLRSFRVLPTDCTNNPASVTDQCFISADETAGSTFSAGIENFGLFIPCVAAAAGSQTTNNLATTPNAIYVGNVDTSLTDAAASSCENDEASNTFFGFDDTGTPDNITASPTVVDNEMIKIVFAATASPTTPTGQYFVTTTYIATPTF
jgi:hypothetical protein